MGSLWSKRKVLFIFETNEEQRKHFKDLLLAIKPDVEIHFSDNETDFMHHLTHQHHSSKNENACKPDLIIINIGQSFSEGFDLLKTIKTNPQFDYIPLIVISHAIEDKNVSDIYGLGVNALIFDGDNGIGFSEKMNKMFHFWIDMIELPNGNY